jgi:uncharacterized surface protein with fasciclin (FAS1) repeats
MKKVLLAVITVLLLMIPLSVQGQELARIRIAHFSPDAPQVQIFVNGAGAGLPFLAFGDVTGWVELRPGTYQVAVAPVGGTVDDAVIGPAPITLRSGQWLTVAATGFVGNGSLGVSTINENYRPLDGATSRVVVLHAIPDAPAVDVILPDGTRLVSGLAFGRSASLDVPAGTYDLAVVAAGTSGPVVLDLRGVALSGNTYYLVSAVGSLAAPGVNVQAIAGSTVAPLQGKRAAAGTIADIVVANPNFSTLEAALVAAGLVGVLDGEEDFTVFAPTNAAFAALPAGTLEAVLADKDLLTSILTYHVVAGTAPASEVVKLSSINTLNGQVRISVTDDGVFLNDTVRIVTTDIPAFNGIIHVIDAVLLPGS